MIISIYFCVVTHINMFSYIFQFYFLCFTLELNTRWSFFFFFFRTYVRTYNGYDNDNKNDNNKLDRLYLYNTHVFIYNKNRKTYIETLTEAHTVSVTGSFAKKALVQTIVCLVLRKYRRKKDRQTDRHAHTTRERKRKRDSELASAYFGNERENSNTQT